MTTSITGAGQPQSFKLADLGIKKEAEVLFQKESIDTADGQVEALVFDSQEAALKHAGSDAGDEAIVQTKDGRWAVLDLKTQYHQLQKLDPNLVEKDDLGRTQIKAEAVFEPDADLHFPNRVMSRTQIYNDGTGNKEAGMDRIQILPAHASHGDRQIERTRQLAQITLSGQVSGFKPNLQTNTVKGDIYRDNLSTVITSLDQSIESLQSQYQQLEADVQKQLAENARALKGEGNAVVDPWIDDKIKSLQNLGAQLEEFKTYRGVFRTRLMTAPESYTPIPGMKQQDGLPVFIGVNRKNFGEVGQSLIQRKGQLQDAMAKAQSPEAKANFQAQIDVIDTEYTSLAKREREVAAAAIAIRMRAGALATISQDLTDASASLKTKTARLMALHEELLNLTTDPVHGPEGPRQKVDDIKAEMEKLKKEIEAEKSALISSMEAEAKTFAKYAPNAKAAQTFLQSQIDEVKALALTDPTKAKAEADKLNTLQGNLLKEIKAKAKIWEGLSPDDADNLGRIDLQVNNYVKDYKDAKAAVKTLAARVDLAEKLPAFAYSRNSLQSVSDARDKWTAGSSIQSGVAANEIINNTYHHLDEQFSKYLGEPPLANWMTFGKYASREAGSQIQNLEAALEALETFKKVDLSRANDTRAAQALVKVIMSDRMLEQAVRMALEVSNDVSSAKVEELLLAGLAGTAVLKGVEFADKMIGSLETLRSAMVKGNTRIYENIAAPFDIYMQAESRGENGLDALKKAGYNGPTSGQIYTTDKVKDPQGYVIGAFTKYKEAKNISDKIEILQKEDPVGNKAEIDKLLAQRKDIIHAANLMIGMQEQLTILQAPDIFEDPMVKRLLGAMSGTMSLTDANGRHELLPGTTPSTANWADFATRMGLKEVPEGTAGALKAKLPDGSIKYFEPTYPNGTISQYFKDGLEGKTVENLIKSPPRDMKPIYQDSVDGQVTWKDRAIDITIRQNPVFMGPSLMVDLIF